MDAAISSISAPQPAPQAQADMRPSADAAALARDPNPTIALAIPASMGQSGAVNASRMTETVSATVEVQSTERVLKPYGVAMLPERASDAQDSASSEAESNDDADPAEG